MRKGDLDDRKGLVERVQWDGQGRAEREDVAAADLETEPAGNLNDSAGEGIVEGNRASNANADGSEQTLIRLSIRASLKRTGKEMKLIVPVTLLAALTAGVLVHDRLRTKSFVQDAAPTRTASIATAKPAAPAPVSPPPVSAPVPATPEPEPPRRMTALQEASLDGG